MKQLHETVAVDSPPSIAMSSIVRHLETHFGILRLSVDLDKLGLPSSLAVAHDIVVEFEVHRNRWFVGRQHDRLDLAWEPQGGGPYPTFKGSLTVRPFGTQTELELRGLYEPPLGTLGLAFEAVAGRKIAVAAAQALLNDIRATLEGDYALFKEQVATSPRRVLHLR